MRLLLNLFLGLLFCLSISCGSELTEGEQTTPKDEAVIKDVSDVYPGDVSSNFIEHSQKSFDNQLVIRNLKENELDIAIISYAGNELITSKLIPKEWNKIDVSKLERGIYYVEINEGTNLIHRNRFIRK